MPAEVTTTPAIQPRPARPPMNVVASYLLSLAACVLAYFAYVRFAVPQLELPVQQIQRVARVSSKQLIPTIDKTTLIPLLPADAWELEECKTLITPTGTVLFKEIVPQPDGTVQLSPFTLITGVGESLLVDQASASTVPVASTKIPLALRTPKGATLTLSKPIQEAIQGGAEIKTARLLGDVDIYRPPSSSDQSDALYVLARNVQFDRHRIYTLDTLNDPVLFSYGAHKGRGRNLRIDLLHQVDTVTGHEDFSTIDGAKQLELAYLDQLIIAAADLADADSPGSAQQSVFADEKASLEISCKGPCLFDFLQQTVTLSDRVSVTQRDQFKNNLSCHQLKISFDKSSAVSGGSKQKLRLVDLIAIGNPVVVNANSKPAKITADRLTYNAIEDTFFAVADPNGSQQAVLETPEIQYKTTQLHCQFAMGPGNRRTLRSLDAQGPGQLLKVGQAPEDEFRANWSQSLAVRPSRQHPGEQIVTVRGDTHVGFQKNSTIDAQRIDIKLRQSSSGQGKSEYAIAEMVASQEVQIQTPKLSGTTDRLTAYFPKPANLRSGSVRGAGYQQEGGASNGISLTTGALAEPEPAGNAQTSEKELRFSGRQVQIAMGAVGKDKLAFVNLEIIDNVSVVQLDPDAPPSASVIKVKGDHLRITPQAGVKRYRLELVNHQLPADPSHQHIQTKDFSLTGQKIILDQTANKVWVDGPGRIQFAKPADVQATDSRPLGGFGQQNTAENAVSDILNADWTGGMIFDGQKIYLERQVQLVAQQRPSSDRLQQIEATCGQVSVALNRFVDLKTTDRDQLQVDEIAPSEIIFVDQIDPSKQVFKGSADGSLVAPGEMEIAVRHFSRQGILQQQQSISAARVTIVPDTKNIFANGPGWVSTHNINTSGGVSPSGAKNPLAQLSGGSATDAANPITFVRVNFAGDLKIDGPTNKMDINDRVRTLYMTTDDWRLNVDPDRVPVAHRRRAVVLTSQQMTLARWQPREANEQQHELTAKGNVHIIGETIDLNSDRVSYNQLQDILVVNGTTRTPARIRYRQISPATQTTSGWQDFSAEKFIYQIATQAISVDGVKKVVGTGSIRLN